MTSLSWPLWHCLCAILYDSTLQWKPDTEATNNRLLLRKYREMSWLCVFVSSRRWCTSGTDTQSSASTRTWLRECWKRWKRPKKTLKDVQVMSLFGRGGDLGGRDWKDLFYICNKMNMLSEVSSPQLHALMHCSCRVLAERAVKFCVFIFSFLQEMSLL